MEKYVYPMVLFTNKEGKGKAVLLLKVFLKKVWL